MKWANGSRYLGSGLLGEKASPAWQIRANTGQSPNSDSMSGQRRRLWFNIETALGECRVFADASVVDD